MFELVMVVMLHDSHTVLFVGSMHDISVVSVVAAVAPGFQEQSLVTQCQRGSPHSCCSKQHDRREPGHVCNICVSSECVGEGRLGSASACNLAVCND